MSPIALADDGALLATDEVAQAPFTVPSSGGPPPILTLYRLPAGSSVWQSLGAVPSSQDTQTGGVSYSNVVYCAAPGKGLLWSISTVATLTAVYP